MKFKEGLRWRPSRDQFTDGVRGRWSWSISLDATLKVEYSFVVFICSGAVSGLGVAKNGLHAYIIWSARVAELVDALDLGSSGQPWGFDSPLSHQIRGEAITGHRRGGVWPELHRALSVTSPATTGADCLGRGASSC